MYDFEQGSAFAVIALAADLETLITQSADDAGNVPVLTVLRALDRVRESASDLIDTGPVSVLD